MHLRREIYIVKTVLRKSIFIWISEVHIDPDLHFRVGSLIIPCQGQLPSLRVNTF